jgi:hypothetical protein
MLTLAVFAVGLFVGAALGVFSLIIMEITVCAVAFCGGWSGGVVAACAHSAEMGMVLAAGFLVALIVSCLSPEFELGIAHWLRRRGERPRERHVMHGPQ